MGAPIRGEKLDDPISEYREGWYGLEFTLQLLDTRSFQQTVAGCEPLARNMKEIDNLAAIASLQFCLPLTEEVQFLCRGHQQDEDVPVLSYTLVWACHGGFNMEVI
jgi:hypothetical protein